jgi:hypothetical protein
MVSRRINWLGLLSSLMLFLLFFTQFTHQPTPWWSLTIGSEDGSLVQAEVSPFLVNICLWGVPVESPLLRYVPLSLSFMILATIITMVLGSLFMEKPWATYLIDFAYLKPALALLFFGGILFAVLWYTGSIFQGDIPLMGDVNIPFLHEDDHILLQTLLPIHTTFSWPIIVAIPSVVLSITTKIYSDKRCQDMKTQEKMINSS